MLLIYVLLLISGFILIYIPFISLNIFKMIRLKKHSKKMKLYIAEVVDVYSKILNRGKQCDANVIIDEEINRVLFDIYDNFCDYENIYIGRKVTLAINENKIIFIDIDNQIDKYLLNE